jgi:imidazolonepropionase
VSSLAISGISELTTNDPGLGDGPLGRLHDAGIILDGATVAWVGPSVATPSADHHVDAAGRAVVPGFVDSHTHLVFAGERSAEFEARLAGAPYTDGGILTTVAATRAASRSELRQHTARLLGAMRRGGTTTVEVKSGYELTVDGERRCCEVASELTEEVTFLGAHAVPEEFTHDRDGYVELVCGPMLDACRELVRWADVFCESVAFSVDETRAIAEQALAAGLGLRLHANQLGHSGGAALGAALGAASVDHCTHLRREDVEALAGTGTVATLLPSADLLTRSAPADARALLDAGVTVALATDCNPGTSYVTSMGLVIALAVATMSMTVDEALWSATRGGALALRRDELGQLGVGARGDLVVLDAARAAHLAYRPGVDLPALVVRRGAPVDLCEPAGVVPS